MTQEVYSQLRDIYKELDIKRAKYEHGFKRGCYFANIYQTPQQIHIDDDMCHIVATVIYNMCSLQQTCCNTYQALQQIHTDDDMFIITNMLQHISHAPAY